MWVKKLIKALRVGGGTGGAHARVFADASLIVYLSVRVPVKEARPVPLGRQEL